MSISYIVVRDECRKRMVAATGINPAEDLQIENYIFDGKRKKVWVSEFCIGGKEIQLSSRRCRIPAFIIQYDLHVPENAGTTEIENMTDAITFAFDVKDPEKSIIQCTKAEILVKSIERNSPKYPGTFTKSVLLTLDVSEKS